MRRHKQQATGSLGNSKGGLGRGAQTKQVEAKCKGKQMTRSRDINSKGTALPAGEQSKRI
jgi:hypothetical protein